MKRNDFLMLIALSIFNTGAFAESPDPFSGYYTANSADMNAGITLLPDQTFCAAFVGGRLDLLIAGHWQKNGADSITIKEHDQEIPTFLIYPNEDESDTEPANPQVQFSGSTLSDDLSIVFGTSPDHLRTILSSGYNGFDPWYKIDVQEGTRSVFIGNIDRKKPKPKSGYAVYKISEYRIDFSQAKAWTVFFNIDSVRDRLDDTWTLENDQIKSSQNWNFTRQKPLSIETMAQLKENCIVPILNNSSAKTWIKPKRKFELELPTDHMAPYFKKSNKDPSFK